MVYERQIGDMQSEREQDRDGSSVSDEMFTIIIDNQHSILYFN